MSVSSSRKVCYEFPSTCWVASGDEETAEQIKYYPLHLRKKAEGAPTGLGECTYAERIVQHVQRNKPYLIALKTKENGEKYFCDGEGYCVKKEIIEDGDPYPKFFILKHLGSLPFFQPYVLSNTDRNYFKRVSAYELDSIVAKREHKNHRDVIFTHISNDFPKGTELSCKLMDSG